MLNNNKNVLDKKKKINLNGKKNTKKIPNVFDLKINFPTYEK